MVNRVIKLEGRGLRGDSYADVARRSGLFGILPTDDDDTVIGKINADAAASADRAELAAEQAADLVLPENRFVAADLATARSDGEAATTAGTYFIAVGEAEGEAEVRLRTAGGSDLIYTEITKAALASAASGKGAALVGFGDSFGSGTVADRINILSATARPAMAGIFSSGADQRLALLDFINEAAAGGKTIEWGPIDLSLDVATPGPVTGRRGLVLPSGSRWVMHPETRIRALPNAAGNYEIINIRDAQDIVIEGSGARIIGERYDHAGTTGEWGMGVSIRGSNNITIRDLIVEDCWGDSLYVGEGSTQNHCRDVLIENFIGERARRNSFSLISAINFTIRNSQFNNTIGTSPENGIDIEPNHVDEFLQGILFEGVSTSGNRRTGFGIYLDALMGTSNPVDIRIVDYLANGDDMGFRVSRDANIPGTIEVVRPKLLNIESNAIHFSEKVVTGPKVKIVDPICIDWNRFGSSATGLGSAVSITSIDRGSSNTYTDGLGNIDIIGADIRPVSSGPVTRAISVSDPRANSPDPAGQMRILEPVDLADLPCSVQGVNTFTDPNLKSVRMLTDANISLNVGNYWVRNVTPDLSTNRAYTLPDNVPVGIELEFVIGGTGSNGRLVFGAGHSLLTEDLGPNNRLSSNTRGSMLRIRKVDATSWELLAKIGTWVNT